MERRGQLVTFPRDKLHPPACPQASKLQGGGSHSLSEWLPAPAVWQTPFVVAIFFIIATESRCHPLSWENDLQSLKSSDAHSFRVSNPGATQLGSSRGCPGTGPLPKHSEASILFLLEDSQIWAYYRTVSHNLKNPGDFQLQQQETRTLNTLLPQPARNAG